ncbi:MAG: transglycosylase SLT domain-containing protein [Lysobacterales bacterium]
MSLLVGCQTLPQRNDVEKHDAAHSVCTDCQPAGADPNPVKVPDPVADTPPLPPSSIPAIPPPKPDPWQLLQSGLQPAGCDQPEVVRWRQRYLGRPERFSGRLTEFAPLLHFVSREVAERQLPQAFSLIPMVESSFYGFPGRGNGPAGMWQLMPATARAWGLSVGGGKDDRLDHVRATHAALNYLQALWALFERDPGLTVAAYNAGDGRVNRAIRKAGHRDSRRLPLPRITQEYLIKLDALACLFKAPEAYGFELPPLPPASQLEVVILPFPADASLLAGALRLPEDAFRRHNGAARGPIARTAGHAWLVPASRIPVIATLDPPTVAPAPGSLRQSAPNSGTHVVQRGDTLWDLSRRYGVRLEDLLRWNSLNSRSTLRIGQRLRLAP